MSRDQQISVVFSTKDYAKFKTIGGNRMVNDAHVRRLKKSFDEEYLLSPILVNERFEIIDGQHRYQAAKLSGRELNYIVAEGYRLPQVQRLNTGTSNWGKKDYLQSYADLGVKAYVQMLAFMNKYPDFGLAAAESLLTQNSGGANNRNKEFTGNGQSGVKNFQNGDLEIADLEFAYEAADKIMLVKPLYDGYTRTNFVRAISVLIQKDNFDMDHFLSKLEKNPGMLSHRNSISEYIEVIEEIYNYRSRSKVNLRF